MTFLPTSTPASEELIWRVNSLEETLKYILENRGGGGLGTKAVLIQRFFLKITINLQLIVMKKWKGIMKTRREP
jgi:hypothetical protein